MFTINEFFTMDPTDGGHTCIPALKVKQPNVSFKEILDSKGKRKAPHNVFLTSPPPENCVPAQIEYPEP